MSVIAAYVHSTNDLEAILKVLPEPREVIIAVYPAGFKSPLVERIESQYNAEKVLDSNYDEPQAKEEKFFLQSPTKQAIIDNHWKYPVYFSEATWDEDKARLRLTRSSLTLEYSGSLPSYFQDLEKALAGTQIEMDVITTINGRHQYFRAKYI